MASVAARLPEAMGTFRRPLLLFPPTLLASPTLFASLYLLFGAALSNMASVAARLPEERGSFRRTFTDVEAVMMIAGASLSLSLGGSFFGASDFPFSLFGTAADGLRPVRLFTDLLRLLLLDLPPPLSPPDLLVLLPVLPPPLVSSSSSTPSTDFLLPLLHPLALWGFCGRFSSSAIESEDRLPRDLLPPISIGGPSSVSEERALLGRRAAEVADRSDKVDLMDRSVLSRSPALLFIIWSTTRAEVEAGFRGASLRGFLEEEDDDEACLLLRRLGGTGALDVIFNENGINVVL